MRTEYIGRHYRSCWDFAVQYYKDRGLDINEAAFDNDFDEVDEPRDDDLALIPRHTDSGHCGIVQGSGVLHPIGSGGVSYQPLQVFEHVRFYRPRSG